MDLQERAQKNYHQNKVEYTPPPRNNPKQPFFVFFWCQTFSSKKPRFFLRVTSLEHPFVAREERGSEWPCPTLNSWNPRIRTRIRKAVLRPKAVHFFRKKRAQWLASMYSISTPLFRNQPPLYLSVSFEKVVGGEIFVRKHLPKR